MARPSIYNEETALELCERLIEGQSLRSICQDDNMPSIRAVMKWLSDGKHPEFVQQYARAKEAQAETLAEEILTIADTPQIGVTIKTKPDGETETTEGDMIQHRRLQVDARKWLASKMAPKKYGDRLELAGEVGVNSLTDEQVDAKLTALLAKQTQDKG
jgi:hypothetical protein